MPSAWLSEKKSAPKPNDKAEWLILNAVENAERRKHMLGAVIPQSVQYFPFDNYSPHWADPDLDRMVKMNDKQVTRKDVLRKTMDALWRSNQDYGEDQPQGPGNTEKSCQQTGSQESQNTRSEDQPVQLNDILTGKVAAKTTGMRAQVTDLFNGFLRTQEAEEVEIKSGLVKRYKIDNPGAKVDDNLMACEPWRDQLQKLFNRTTEDNSHFLLVTGLLVCDDLEVRWKRDQSSNANIGTKISGKAVLAAAGAPANPGLAAFLDSKFEFDQARSNAESVFARCKHAVIFAVRYNYLDLTTEKSPGWLARNVLGAHPTGIIKHAKMDGVVLGRGVHSFAHAQGKTEQDASLLEEEEALNGDWFYSRPPGNATNDVEDYDDRIDDDTNDSDDGR